MTGYYSGAMTRIQKIMTGQQRDAPASLRWLILAQRLVQRTISQTRARENLRTQKVALI